jgi:uncharacterized RDD family membrane protein YckC
MLYESLLLLATVFLAGFLFVGLTRGANTPPVIVALQVYVLAVTAAYFIWFWLHGGQTLAMKTWRLRLVDTSGQPITPRLAATRFVLAIPCVLTGIGLLWAVFDPERQFLHDRLAGTRLIGTD